MKYYSTTEVIEFSGYSRRSIYRIIEKNKIKTIKKEGRHLITEKDVVKYFSKNVVSV